MQEHSKDIMFRLLAVFFLKEYKSNPTAVEEWLENEGYTTEKIHEIFGNVKNIVKSQS